jgi:hypothetical protein
MLVECTQCHRSAMVCDCPANPAGTADRITDLKRQLAEAQQELSAEREKVRVAREGLLSLEWSDGYFNYGDGISYRCPVCKAPKASKWGHASTCWLSALIAKLEVKG